MPETVKVNKTKKNITVTQEIWDLAKQESLRVMGSENVSGFFAFLINQSNKNQ